MFMTSIGFLCFRTSDTPQTPAVLPSVVSVSAFKNGFAFVTREIKVDANGDAEFPSLQGALGTIWFTPDSGMKVEWVRTVNKDTAFKMSFVDNFTVLTANVGKTVQLTLKDDDVLGNMVTGKLERVVQTTAVIRVGTTQHLISNDRIVAVACVDGEFVLDRELKTVNQVYKIHTSGSAGKVRYTALQSGFGWAPSYSITLEDDSHLQFKARTTLFNSMEVVKGATVRMVTGFPNTAFAMYTDSLAQDYSAYLSMIAGLDIDNPMPTNANRFAFRNSGGGFGGAGGARANEGFGGQAAGAMGPGGAPGMPPGEAAGAETGQPEDQYTFVQQNVDIDAGGRTSFDLFSGKCGYERIYRCNLTDGDVQRDESTPKPPDVWQILQFKNETGKPLTTAIGALFEQDVFLAQAAIKYTAPGAKGEIKLAKALSVPVEAAESESGRDKGAIKTRPADRKQVPVDMYDAVMITGTISVTNPKDRPITFVVTRDVTGEVRDRDGGAYTSSTKNLRAVNKSGRLEWKKKVEAGKTETIKYSYRIMVPSPKGD